MPALAGDHDRRQEEAVDRARGADRELARVAEQQRSDRAGDQRDEVDGDEASGPDRRLEHLAEDVEGEHVEGEVDDRPVQEAGGEHAPPLAAVGLQEDLVAAADAAVADRVAAERAVGEDACRRC